MINIYVGNLPFSLTDDELHDLFSEYGSVSSARQLTDRETGRPRGFGFVEMESKEDGEKAIENLNGTEIDGRALKVNEARPREERPRGNFGGGGGGGGGGFGRDNRGGGRDRGRRGDDRRERRGGREQEWGGDSGGW